MRSATKKKTGKDKACLEWIRSLDCWICFKKIFGDELYFSRAEPGIRMSESAHVGNRGLSQKCPDREAIPLCAEHHRLDRFSAHRMGKKFWEHYGLDKAKLIETLNQRFEEEHGNRTAV